MNTSETIAPSSLETLKAMVAGDVFVAGDGGYDEARRAWDLVVDQRPTIVVYAEPASYDRLQRIKATYDPDQTIISAHPVRPIET